MIERNSQQHPEFEQRKPGLVIAALGKESLKAVDGRIQRAIPFVGTDRPGQFSSLGVGVLLPDNDNRGQIWGLVMPHMVIQSWRGMKILENVEVIEPGTLCAAWYVGGREVHPSEQRYIDEFSSKIGKDKFETQRAGILEQAPPADELERMLNTLRDNQVNVSTWELQQEVEAGRIGSSPLIDELVADDGRKRQEYEMHEEELKIPIEKERSVAVLFRDLGIDNLITGGGFGAYGIDWGHITPEQLEKDLRRFGYYSDHGEHLLRTTKSPRTAGRDLGEIENPSVTAPNNMRYTFTEARFVEGNFSIQVRVQKPGGEQEEAEYTVQQLREVLGNVIQARQEQQKPLNRLLGFFRGN